MASMAQRISCPISVSWDMIRDRAACSAFTILGTRPRGQCAMVRDFLLSKKNCVAAQKIGNTSPKKTYPWRSTTRVKGNQVLVGLSGKCHRCSSRHQALKCVESMRPSPIKTGRHQWTHVTGASGMGPVAFVSSSVPLPIRCHQLWQVNQTTVSQVAQATMRLVVIKAIS